MAVTREQILAHLKIQFPDRVIHPETYTLKMVGAIYQLGIRKLAKEQKLTQGQWLQENGFLWRETGYVEPDMRSYSDAIKRNGAVALADSVMRCYPLIGAYEPSEAERGELLAFAQRIVQKLFLENRSLNRPEELVLTVSTVQLAKAWSSEIRDEDGTSFWKHIFLQFGFNPENSPAAEQRVYAGFRHAIKTTLTHYHRYLAPKTTMRYYTSLMLHAVAPVQSIENLLDILFDFYVKNLDFQYQPEDPVYRTLVRGMQARWTDTAKAESFQLRSSEVMSGLKTLFLERPGFMAHICETLVRKLDGLLRGKPLETRDRWDVLLKNWYEKKSRTERTSLQGQKRAHRTEFVATTADRIYLQYAMESGLVGIVVPRIRLTEIGDTRPLLTLYQGPREIWRETLSVTGNDLSLTTRRRFLPLSETDLDWDRPLELCGEVEYLGEILYTSGSRLFREYLLFDAGGNERSVRSGTAYLFAGACCNVEFAEYDAVLQENHPGQLYRIALSQVGTVTIDGTELFADEQRAGTVRLYPTVAPVRGISALQGGKRYRVFDRVFEMTMHLPEGANSLRYQLLLDGTQLPCEAESEGRLRVPLDSTPNAPHIVRVVDLVQNLIVKEIDYMLFTGLSYRLNKAFYMDTEEQAAAVLSHNSEERELKLTRIRGTDIAQTVTDYDGISYEIDLPTIHCSFGAESAFALPERLWKGNVDKTVLSQLRLPPGWTGALWLGLRALSPDATGFFEIGNHLWADASDDSEMPLWLNLHTPDGKQERLLLTQVVLRPSFVEPPFEIDGDLLWAPEGRFFGDPNARFRVILSGKSVHIFELGSARENLRGERELEHGYYHYEIYLKTGGLFSRVVEKKLLDGEILYGNEQEFRYQGKEFHLSSALYWNFERDCLELQSVGPGAAILTRLSYLGESIPSGETIALPEYEAALCFEMPDGRRIPFNAREDSVEYELVNPVRVWIVNERRLILRTVTEDALYFDTGNASLMNRRPERVMSRMAQRLRLQTPDYYDYEVRGEQHV